MTWQEKIIRDARDKTVAESIVEAISKLFERDRVLFEIDANERSITHRLGIYLQEKFSDWDVDCEYNKEGNNAKHLCDKIGAAAPDDTDAKTVYPDIIIHKRNNDENNKVIIEVKKAKNSQPNEIDLNKLSILSKRLKYENALFLRLKTGKGGIGVTEFCWVIPGEMDDCVNN